MYTSVIWWVFQVSQFVENLEKLLDGPSVSQSLGKKAISLISNLMDGDPSALSASANRLYSQSLQKNTNMNTVIYFL